MSGTCFIIQPFDGGKFNKRFDDVYKSAIEKAGLNPYRVDHDPSVVVPIEEIKRGIEKSAICFVDISTNNPNVWFEFGYALAARKEICIACSDEREGAFPFDVRHFSIIKYQTESSSDFKKLAADITEKCLALLTKQKTLTELPTVLTKTDRDGLSSHERACLAAIVMEGTGLKSKVGNWAVKQAMEPMGFNNLATNIALSKLSGIELIAVHIEMEQNFNTTEEYECYSLTQSGWDWVGSNLEHLELASRGNDTDEFPF